MPAAARLGDYCSGHSSYPPRPNIEASSNVYINGKGWHRKGDLYTYHCNDDDCHNSILKKGSSTVFVNDLNAGRIGDPVACGICVAQGSGNVYSG